MVRWKKIEATYVAKNYKQTEVNDNFETFAPTSNSGTLSTLYRKSFETKWMLEMPICTQKLMREFT